MAVGAAVPAPMVVDGAGAESAACALPALPPVFATDEGRERLKAKLLVLEEQEAQLKAEGKLNPELTAVVAEAKQGLLDAFNNL